jgi:hypothetical protein
MKFGRHIDFKNNYHIYITFLISIVSFCAILIPRELHFLKLISVLARYNTTRVVPVLAVLLFITLLIKERSISIIAASAFIFPLFALALNGLWAGAYTENNVIAGLIPRTDAFSFYTGAVSLVESGYLVGYARRRPLFGGFLGFILWVCGGNLQIALSVITYLVAVVIFISFVKISESFVSPAAIIYLLVVFLFSRRQIGITMSETLGLLLGVIALLNFTIFINTFKSNIRQSRFFFILGVALFTLGQAARPGAVATIPLLVLFAGWVFRNDKKFSWKWMFVTLVSVIFVYYLDSVLYRMITQPGGTQINNIGYGIYGLVVGGKGWEQIFIDHPIINQLPPGAREQKIMALIWQSFISNPENLLHGMLVQFRILFSFSPANSVYSFAWSNNIIFNYYLISFLYILAVLGIISTYLRKREEIGLLMIVFVLGFFFSLFFAPAYQQQYMRLYAASVPMLGFLPAFGMDFLMQRLAKKHRIFNYLNRKQSFNFNGEGSALISLLLIVILFIGPITTRKFGKAKEIPETIGCLGGQDEVIMKYYPGSSIHIYRNDPSIMTWVPSITQLDYKGSIHRICCGDEITYFKNIPAPNTMYPALNLINGNEMYLISNESLLPDKYGLLRVCGYIENVLGEAADRGFLYPQSIEFLN